MAIFLVRHAKAGRRSLWTGDDSRRPLDEVGAAQAVALAESLAGEDPATLVSSPFLRCVQTLEPLARLTGLAVDLDDRLAEDTPFESTLALLSEVPDRAVLCSHGDVIPAAIDALLRRGMVLARPVDKVRKASTFVLDRADGVFTRAVLREPPPVDPRR